jgi:hypothetical protein
MTAGDQRCPRLTAFSMRADPVGALCGATARCWSSPRRVAMVCLVQLARATHLRGHLAEDASRQRLTDNGTIIKWSVSRGRSGR